MKTFKQLIEAIDRVKPIGKVPAKRGEFDGVKNKKEAAQMFFKLYSGKSRTRANWQTMLKSLKDEEVISDRQYMMWRSEYQESWMD